VLEQMANGHPDAFPTKAAKESLNITAQWTNPVLIYPVLQRGGDFAFGAAPKDYDELVVAP
jgi:hypothetical protein